MAEALEPATDRWVVRATESPTLLAEALERVGAVEKLGTTEPLYVLTLTSPQPVRDVWIAVSKALGENGAAFPVLIDRDGAPRYPTGEVTVRFLKMPSAAELKAFAVAHRLKLERTNELAPLQFVFAPIAPAAEFLPDLVARLASQPGVRSAWANTLGAYRRGVD